MAPISQSMLFCFAPLIDSSHRYRGFLAQISYEKGQNQLDRYTFWYINRIQIDRTEIKSIQHPYVRMASSDQTASAIPQSETSRSGATPIDIHVVNFHAEDWSHGLTLLDGRASISDDWGTLCAYSTPFMARVGAIEWALKQLEDHLSTHRPPLENERDRDAAFDEWEKWEPEDVEDGNGWWYMISKGDERLQVKVEKIVLYDHIRSGSLGENRQGRGRALEREAGS